MSRSEAGLIFGRESKRWFVCSPGLFQKRIPFFVRRGGGYNGGEVALFLKRIPFLDEAGQWETHGGAKCERVNIREETTGARRSFLNDAGLIRARRMIEHHAVAGKTIDSCKSRRKETAGASLHAVLRSFRLQLTSDTAER